jgi:hypothetical protein
MAMKSTGTDSITGESRNKTVEEIKDLRNDTISQAMNPRHVLIPNNSWKDQKKLWAKANDNQRKDYLYGMILHDGVCADTKRGLALIAKFFAIKVKDLDDYQEVIEMADAARVLKVNRNQLRTFLGRDDQPMGKFFVGKQYAYQVGEPKHEGVESIDDGSDITIKVMTPENSSVTQADDDSPVLAEESTPILFNHLN